MTESRQILSSSQVLITHSWVNFYLLDNLCCFSSCGQGGLQGIFGALDIYHQYSFLYLCLLRCWQSLSCYFCIYFINMGLNVAIKGIHLVFAIVLGAEKERLSSCQWMKVVVRSLIPVIVIKQCWRNGREQYIVRSFFCRKTWFH